MSSITTHVLDTSQGQPADGLAVVLERNDGSRWQELAVAATDVDGRVTDLLPDEPLETGTYRLVFATGDYHQRRRTPCFYPQVTVEFLVTQSSSHYHVPLLLSPYGYSTYRGS